MQYVYQARNSGGDIRTGEVIAATVEEAAQLLRQDGLYLLKLEESAPRPNAAAATSLMQRRISRRDIVYLTNQLAVMVDAGVSLADALSGLARQSENPSLKKLLEGVQQHVENGESLSAALARSPKQFDQTYVNLVKASEVSGLLAPMLDRIAAQMQSELETRQKVRAALTYPAVMLVMCVGVSIFLLTYVFPKLMPMFETRSLELPGPTRLMMVVSTALTHHAHWCVLAAAVVAGGGAYACRQPWGRTALDWFWLHVPILGPMLRKVALSRSLRTLATTISAGVPVLDALQLSAGVAKNVFYERCWLQVAEQVMSGRQIHEALEGNRLFPSTLLQMIASGEATGKLGDVLNKVSDYFDREVATAVKAATSIIEPIMVLVMGGVIGTIALAMLLPIFRLSSHVG